MAVPTLITDLSTTPASNSPAGSENVFPNLDDYLRVQAAFLASVRDNSGNGWVSPYLPLAGGTMTGSVSGFTATTGTFSGNVQMASANGGQLAGLRNRIINGDMSVAQRGTSGALTTSYAYLSVDRFAGTQSTTASGVLAQVAAGLSGFSYAAKIGRTAASTNTGAIILRSALETTNSVSLQGQQVTLSFYAKAGANFSATSSNITAQIFTGTGTDQSVSIMNTWTGSANPISTATAITTTWTRYSFTATLSSTATQVGVTLFYTPVGTAGADDNLYITGVQLEVGPVATPFEQRPYGMEIGLCYRYYYKQFPGVVAYRFCFGGVSGPTGAVGMMMFPVQMRIIPALEQTGTANQYQVSQFTSAVTCNAVPTIITSYSSVNYGGLQFAVASGLTVGSAAVLQTDNTNGATAFIAWSAEL